MQPKVLHLPDSLRDRLEARLSAAARLPAGEAPKAEEQAVRELLYPETIPSDDQAFLAPFQQAMRHVYYGTGTPALTLENLPANTGGILSEALHRLLGDGNDHIMPVIDTYPQEMHHDYGAPAIDETGQTEKTSHDLAILYCEHPGSLPQPTVFVTADELIERWTEERAQAGENKEEARQHIIARLSAATAIQDSQLKSLWGRNAGFTPGCGAPEFTLCSPYQCNIIEPKEAANGESLRDTLQRLFDTLRDEGAKTSTTNTHVNTFTIFNDALLIHGRGPCIAEGAQKGRIVVGLDVASPREGQLSPFLQVAFGTSHGPMLAERVRY